MTANMDHTDATLSGAAERYILGEMAADERERYEAHFFECAECADEVRAASRFVDAAKPLLQGPASGSAGRRRATRSGRKTVVVAGLHRRLPSDGARGGRGRGAARHRGRLPVARAHSRAQAATGRWRRPAGGARRVPVGRARRTSCRPVDPRRPIRERQAQPQLDRAFPHYRVDLQDSTGRTIQSRAVAGRPNGDELTMMVSVHGLAAGAYTLVVVGLESETGTPASDSIRYPFKLEWRDAPR